MKKIISGALALALTLGATSHSQAQEIYSSDGSTIIYGNSLADLGERLGKLGEELGERLGKLGEELGEGLGESLGNLSVELGSLGEEIAEGIENGDIDGNIYINGKRISSKDFDKSQQRFRGSGNIITEQRTVPSDYRGIRTSRAIKVTLEDRSGSTAIIRADDNVMPHIKIEDNGGILEIKIDDKIRSINNITAEVSLPKSANINLLEASSASRINVNYTIQSSTLEIDAASAANIYISKADVNSCDIEVASAAHVKGSIIASRCEIEASSAAHARLQLLTKSCEADASSAAKIVLSGEAGLLSADASSAADIDAANLKVLNKGIASASSGADIKVQAGESLSAEASSGGSVRYKSENDLNIHIKKSSGGSVRKM